MSASIVAFLAAAEAKFIRAPGLEDPEALAPGEKSLMVLTEGTGALLSTGAVTMVLLPALAAILFVTGHRVAAPMVVLVAVGLFLARMFGAHT